MCELWKLGAEILNAIYINLNLQTVKSNSCKTRIHLPVAVCNIHSRSVESFVIKT